MKKNITIEMAKNAISYIQWMVKNKKASGYKTFKGAFNWYIRKKSPVFKGMYPELKPYLEGKKDPKDLTLEKWIKQPIKNFEKNELEELQIQRLAQSYVNDPNLYYENCGVELFPNQTSV